MLNKEEIEVLNSNDWNKGIRIIEEHWNTDYGTISVDKTESGIVIIELTTGGWSENEELIDKLANTMFWFLWWNTSKRGGYYKFIYSERMEVEE